MPGIFNDVLGDQPSFHWDMGVISQHQLPYYDIALPQAYLEVFARFGNGLNVKIGHFYTIIGYESVPSPPNFFSSHIFNKILENGIMCYSMIVEPKIMLYKSRTPPDIPSRNTSRMISATNWVSESVANGFGTRTVSGIRQEKQAITL